MIEGERPDLRISATFLARGVMLELEGALGRGSAAQIQEALIRANQKGAPAAILNLRSVVSCDVNGVGAIIATAKRAKLVGMRLIVAELSPVASQALHGQGLEQNIEFRENVAEAIAALEE